MRGTAIDFGVSQRSIAGDDIAGVQAIYGVRDATKPRVDDWRLVSGPGGPLMEVDGEHFGGLAGLEVWFPDGGPAADGTPLQVAAARVNFGGTRLHVEIPAGVGRGDFAVKRAGSTGAALSNAFPFDESSPPCEAPEEFGTPKTTSVLTQPVLYTSGSPKQSVGTFALACDGGVPSEPGVLFFGGGRTSRPFYGGVLYAAPPLRRQQGFTFDFAGGVFLPIEIEDFMLGRERVYQLWFRDSGDPQGVGISSAVAVTFCP